jgi:predicted homoserine dehydrogenase-like protein
LKRDVPKDALLTFDDVELPQNRLCDQLWREQMARFFPEYSQSSSGENK